MANLSILDQLKNENVEVKNLFTKAQNCKVSDRDDMVQKIKEELLPHARGEEKTIYSLLKGILDKDNSPRKDVDLINEAYEEHRVMDDLLKNLEEISTDDQRWFAHLKVLKENVEHHIEKEEFELFKLINKHFSEDRLDELRTVYLSVKETYSESLPSQSQINERRPDSTVPLF